MLKLWWANSKWIVILVVATAFAVAIWCLRGIFAGPSGNTGNPQGGFLPLPPKPLQDAADNAAEAAIAAKAATKATTEEKKKELDRLAKLTDAQERRKALAAFIAAS